MALETMLRGICKKENFLDLLENFILFDHSGGRGQKAEQRQAGRILAHPGQRQKLLYGVSGAEDPPRVRLKTAAFWSKPRPASSLPQAALT